MQCPTEGTVDDRIDASMTRRRTHGPLSDSESSEAPGPNLGYPHSSSLKEHGDLRELRPRGGRSLWRAFYRRIGDAFVVAAVGPAAEHDKRGFDRAARRARTRLDEIAED